MKMRILAICIGVMIAVLISILPIKFKVRKWYKALGLVLIAFCIIATGGVINEVTRIVNDGEMPVSEELIFIDDELHKQADENTKLRFFIDRYEFESELLNNGVYSIGDIIISIGIFIIIPAIVYVSILCKRKLIEGLI